MIRFLLLAVTFLLGSCSGTVEAKLRVRQQPWSADAIDAVAALPVQDGGRVKPLSTVAMFALLGINGNRDYTLRWSDGQSEKLSATAWLLDCLFFPEQARHYRCLRIDNDEAVAALGLHFDDRKRLDRYSYEELRPAHDRLMQLGSEYQLINAKDRTPVQQQVFTLANQMVMLDRLLAWLDFARARVDVHRTNGLKAAFAGDAQRPVSWALKNLPVLLTMRDMVHEPDSQMGTGRRDEESAGLAALFDDLYGALRAADTIAFLPPADPANKTWWHLHDLAGGIARGAKPEPGHLQAVEQLEAMAKARDDQAAFTTAAQGLLATTRAPAAVRGEYAKVPTEVSFYRADYFYRALLVFGLSFILAAFCWARPRSVWLFRGALATISLGTVLLIIGIVLRCIIRGRPPVSTLYETILFISANAVLVALVIEWLHPRRVGLTLAAFFGMGGMFLARRFEELEGSDTMPQLQAVLDTNFWLSTHVTTVTMGYAAGLLAALIGGLYIIGKLTGKADASLLGAYSKMLYGVLCFGLIFSLIGTILGGVWANYSWGRFWGWDPKENGALLICLAEISILHARMAGWLKHHGMAMAAVANGIVVAFSWWHVNLLGVGLHSYGFTGGILTALTAFYLSQLTLLVAGAIAYYRVPAAAAAREPTNLPVSAAESGS